MKLLRDDGMEKREKLVLFVFELNGACATFI